MPASAAPAISVVVVAYRSRERIGPTLRRLRDQDLDEPYEVVVVSSGGDGCAAYVETEFPECRVISCPGRLLAGQGRNRGVAAARAPYVAFMSDDTPPEPGWLRARLRAHRRGFDAVAGSIVNGTPWHPIGSAGYYLEYSALIPSRRVLAEQAVPHALSYDKAVLERIGGFPEDIATGEDTVAGERCRASGASIAFEPEAALAHRNLRRPGAYLRHQYEHGRGLVDCIRSHAIESPLGDLDAPTPAFAWRAFAAYPARRWRLALGRLVRGRARWVPGYLALTPVVWAGLWAVSAGALAQRRA